MERGERTTAEKDGRERQMETEEGGEGREGGGERAPLSV